MQVNQSPSKCLRIWFSFQDHGPLSCIKTQRNETLRFLVLTEKAGSYRRGPEDTNNSLSSSWIPLLRECALLVGDTS